MHALDAIHQVGAGVGNISDQFGIAQTGNNLLEHYAHFQSGEVRTQTEMLANTESAVLVVQIGHTLGATHIKLHGIFTKDGLVVIYRVIVHDDLVALLDQMPANFRIFHDIGDASA